MKTLIHISDLHFGKVDKKRVQPLLDMIGKINPSMVVISGDFTQRATAKEFQEAKDFMSQIKKPIFAIPGNHDIPLYNVLKRFYNPFKEYIKFISPDLSPFYQDEEIALIGINSVRSSTITSGRISKDQLKEVEGKIKNISKDLVKIVVCHHPFDIPASLKSHHKHTHKVIGHSAFAMKELSKHNVDVFLSGHLHLHYIADTSLRYKIKDYSGLIVQAGTAISSRARGEPVSFNVLHIDRNTIVIEHYVGSKKSAHFELGNTERFTYTPSGWKKETK